MHTEPTVILRWSKSKYVNDNLKTTYFGHQSVAKCPYGAQYNFIQTFFSQFKSKLAQIFWIPKRFIYASNFP